MFTTRFLIVILFIGILKWKRRIISGISGFVDMIRYFKEILHPIDLIKGINFRHVVNNFCLCYIIFLRVRRKFYF